MALWQIFVTSSLFLVGVSDAAVLQYPLQADNFDFSYSDAVAWNKLHAVVGDRLVKVEPIGAPCYNSTYNPKPEQCDFSTNRRTDDIWTSDQRGGYYYGNLPACQATGETCVLPLLKNSTIPVDAICHQGSVPPDMIEIKSMDTLYSDVKAAFEYTRSTKTPLVIKNTGHDWKGRSSGPGSLALWMHQLRHPNVPIELEDNFVPVGCSGYMPEKVLHFGPGEQWGKAYEFANNHSLAIVGGTCPSVGIAGWLQGGGHSPMTPTHGMGVDNVRQLEIITPNRGVLIANECQNSDLFFAMRGGGGGTFGIISNITYRTFDKQVIQDFRYTINVTGDDLQKYFDILASSAVSWSKNGWGGYIKTSWQGQSAELINPNRTDEKAMEDMAPLLKFVKEHGAENVTIKHQDSWYDYIKLYMEPKTTHVGLWGWNTAARLMPASAFEDKNRVSFKKALTTMYDSNLFFWLMLVAPTKFNHTTTSSLHPTWNSSVLSIRAGEKWDQFSDHESPDLYRQHYTNVHTKFEGIRNLAPDSGVSISEADIWEEDHTKLFWGNENHLRLQKIKDEVDPDNLLTNYQAVNWEPTHTRYRCYPTPQSKAFLK